MVIGRRDAVLQSGVFPRGWTCSEEANKQTDDSQSRERVAPAGQLALKKSANSSHSALKNWNGNAISAGFSSHFI
jgi:hypothetical protein